MHLKDPDVAPTLVRWPTPAEGTPNAETKWTREAAAPIEEECAPFAIVWPDTSEILTKNVTPESASPTLNVAVIKLVRTLDAWTRAEHLAAKEPIAKLGTTWPFAAARPGPPEIPSNGADGSPGPRFARPAALTPTAKWMTTTGLLASAREVSEEE